MKSFSIFGAWIFSSSILYCVSSCSCRSSSSSNLVFVVPGELAGACFIGFAIGESLGASALRVAGGIFTKIADIGSDLMKIQFGIKEDDPRNPGVIADCTGDNAGDSIGPTADGFETYGVTGVALVSFILLGVFKDFQVQLLAWIFTMRFLCFRKKKKTQAFSIQ
jgi:K(+)-stimulated pyrophosphate-energized sodium pump